MTPQYGPRPAAERDASIAAAVELAPSMAAACMAVSRARDGRTFACARLAGHDGTHYGADRSGPVRLGYGR